MALTDECTVLYLCSTPYKPGSEHGIDPIDPAIGIEWPADVAPLLSPKDAAAPSLDEALRAGLLPQYADCISYPPSSLRDRSRLIVGPDRYLLRSDETDTPVTKILTNLSAPCCDHRERADGPWAPAALGSPLRRGR